MFLPGRGAASVNQLMKSLSSFCFSCQHDVSRRGRRKDQGTAAGQHYSSPGGGFTVIDLCKPMVIYGLFTGEDAAKIEALLLNSIAAPEEGRRLAAAQWALRLFDFRHVPARYVCVLAAGDGKLEVKEAGASGLKPPKTAAAGETARICSVQLQLYELAAGAARFEAEDIRELQNTPAAGFLSVITYFCCVRRSMY